MHVVIYSGGLDSFTLLHYVREMLFRQGLEPQRNMMALSFDYGQRHRKELGFAREECARLELKHHVVDLRNVGDHLSGSSLTDRRIKTPHGHYEAENMKLTVVPGRNSIMLTVAMGIAEASTPTPEMREQALTPERPAYRLVYYGAHSGDHHIYPDCRPEYIAAMKALFANATEGKVGLLAPFQHMSKTRIVGLGRSLDLDYARTWTCYEGGDYPCGECGACQERAEAFAQNGLKDPLLEVRL